MSRLASSRLADKALIVDCEHKTAPLVDVGDIYSIRTADLSNGRIDFNSANRVAESTYREWTQRDTPIEGDVILAREAPVGEVGRVPKNKRVCLGQRTVLIRLNQTDVDSGYLLYYLVSPEIKARLVSRSTGSVVEHLNVKDIRDFEIEYPPLPEQRAIAHILGSLDDKIELNRQMDQTLEALTQALFKSWFMDFEPFRDQGMQDSPLGEIPVGWMVGTFRDVADNPRRGIQPDQIKANTPYIGLEHMPRRCIALAEWGQTDQIESNKFQFQRGEILFGKLRPYFHKVGVAPIDGVCSTDILVVTAKESRWFGFVLGHISSVEFVSHTDAASTGTKMPRTNWEDMARYKVVLPPKPIAEVFTELVRPLIDRIISNIYESHALSSIRDTLLPKLLSGEIQLKDADRFVEKAA